MLSQFITNGICSGALYAIVALGFGLIYNTTNVFHFAHGAVYTVSAYLTFLFLIILKIPPLISILLALILTTLFGVLIQLTVYQPLEDKKSSPPTFLMSSFGVYLFTINLIALIFGNEVKIINSGIEKTFSFGDIILTRIQIISLITFIIITILYFLFKRLKIGKLITAYSNNPDLVEVLGWNGKKIKITVYALGSLLAGVSSILSALDIGMDPYVGMHALLISAVAVIIGGVKIFEGAIVGGLTLGILQSLVIWQISAKWSDAFTFIILIIFLLFKPEGLLGKKLRIEETT